MVNTRLLRVGLMMIAAAFLAYGFYTFAERVVIPFLTEGLPGSQDWIRRIPLVTDSAIDLVAAAGLAVAAAATWKSPGPARFLFVAALLFQIVETSMTVMFALAKVEPRHGIEWGRYLAFVATRVGLWSTTAFGVHFGIKSASRPAPIGFPIAAVVATALAQLVLVAHTAMESDGPRAEAPNILWRFGHVFGFGLVIASLLLGAASLRVESERDAWPIARGGFAGVRTVAIARLVVGVGSALLMRLCIAMSSFGACYWLLVLVTPITLALGYWGIASVATVSRVPRIAGVAFVSVACFVAATTLDTHASIALLDFLRSASRDRYVGMYALDGLPSLTLGAGLLQLVATATLFRVLVLASEDRGLSVERSDAARGMGLAIAAALCATLVNAALSGAKPWFGLLVALPFGIVALVVGIMAYAALLRVTRTLSIVLLDDR
ncbi:MAG: hypothetical protein U0414_23230 [Polyangiaceae bacterium]